VSLKASLNWGPPLEPVAGLEVTTIVRPPALVAKAPALPLVPIVCGWLSAGLDADELAVSLSSADVSFVLAFLSDSRQLASEEVLSFTTC